MSAEVQTNGRGRDYWAKQINDDWAAAMQGWGDTLKAVHRTGLSLETAKAELSHGEWMTMVESDLPFQQTKAQNLIAISKSGICQINTTGANLPISWRTLYELSRVDENELEAAVKDGRVHIDMTRADAKKLATPENLRTDLKTRKKREPKVSNDQNDDEDDDEMERAPALDTCVSKIETTIRDALNERPVSRAERDRLFNAIRQRVDIIEAFANKLDQTETEGDA
jgi:hypothetical protein